MSSSFPVMPEDLAALGWELDITYPKSLKGREQYTVMSRSSDRPRRSSSDLPHLIAGLRELEQLPNFAAVRGDYLLPAYMTCESCPHTVLVKAKLSHDSGCNGSLGRLEIFPIEVPEGWWVRVDRMGRPLLAAMCLWCRRNK